MLGSLIRLTMRYQKNHIFLVAIVAAALAIPSLSQAQRRPRFATTTEVRIYLWQPEEAGQPETLGLTRVQRRVNRIAPARGALEALIQGPAGDEREKGLRAPHTEGLFIKDLVIENGVARVSFASDCPDCPRWTKAPSAQRFRKAVELTLKQFPTVSAVKICFDGYEDFDDAKKKKCQ